MPILGIMASQISGHLWEPAGAYESIATVTVGTATPFDDFTSITGTYTHLQLRLSGFTTNNFGVQFNSDTSAAYTYHRLIGNGTSASASGASSTGRTLATFGAGASLSYATVSIVDILDYTSTAKTKTLRVLTGHDENSTTGEVALYSNLWTASPVAITSIRVLIENASNIGVGSKIALYGIRGN